MKYNEQSGEFEREEHELVGYYAGKVGYCVGYVAGWILAAAVVAAVLAGIWLIAKFVWRMLG